MFSKKLKIATQKLLFDETELPSEGESIYIFDTKAIWPRIAKIWKENPLYLCSYNASPEVIKALESGVANGRTIGKIILHQMFRERVSTTLPVCWSENHGKVYLCEPYAIIASANLSKNDSTEFFTITNKPELNAFILKQIFGVNNAN